MTTGDPRESIATTGKYAGPSWWGCMTNNEEHKNQSPQLCCHIL